MQLRRLAAACGAVLALACPAATQTDSPAAVMANWGMLGAWAVDCATPASQQNGYSVYAADPSGGASLSRDFGAAYERDRSQILAAQIVADGMISITINFVSLNQTRTNVFMKTGDGGMRAFSNRASDGSFTVRDGRFLHNGAATPTQFRCR